MHTCPLTPHSLVLRMLGALLLLTTALSTQNGRWDRPACTEGVVSVSRGGRAVLACNSSNAFTHITVQLSAHGKTRTIFSEETPGSFLQGGWWLQVRGGQARLVIQSTQDAHQGLYLWHLQGLQRHNKETRLNILEAQEQATEPGPVLSTSASSVSLLSPGAMASNEGGGSCSLSHPGHLWYHCAHSVLATKFLEVQPGRRSCTCLKADEIQSPELEHGRLEPLQELQERKWPETPAPVSLLGLLQRCPGASELCASCSTLKLTFRSVSTLRCFGQEVTDFRSRNNKGTSEIVPNVHMGTR
ncbi:PREDICTED: secreted and transmembrane protein 1A-like [Chinchilla lanigera]|nr:PREDICTED: secreted and transmembrane protein 1A-like [Chinchilla lanigera]